MTICALYKSRWQVKLLFKWIKQHLRIKQFYGISENAVKTQIWIAVSVYVLIAIVKKRLRLEVSLYTLLQVFSVTVFEKMPIQAAILATPDRFEDVIDSNQLELFTFLPDSSGAVCQRRELHERRRRRFPPYSRRSVYFARPGSCAYIESTDQ